MKFFVDQVLEGLDKGEIKLVFECYMKVNCDWLENICDWNIFWQLWWGYQILVWYDKEGNIYVFDLENFEFDCDQDFCYVYFNLCCDFDVFDIWFLSNLWFFFIFGWFDIDSEDFCKFYLMQVLVIGYDIFFFWVVCMQMVGYGLIG